MADPRPEIVGLTLGDPAVAWSALGFTVSDGVVWLDGVRVQLEGLTPGIHSWTLGGIAPVTELDGLPTVVEAAPVRNDSPAHANGAVGIDHVVGLTPDFERTAGALEAAGMPLRRVRTVGSGEKAFQQGFRRMGPTIFELVEGTQLPPGPCRFWGLTLIVEDLDSLAERLGPELVSAPKDAVQPGRRIATLRAAAGLSQAVALMTPEPAR
jgi:hypothetical protein